MTLDDIPVLAMLKSRLGYLADRQRVIAQNVANSDTPGFTPMDLKPFTVPGASSAGALAPIAVEMTSPMHLAAPNQATGASSQAVAFAQNSETTLNGNSVVLEDEMMKMTQARIDYDAAIGFYQQSIAMLQTAAERPPA